MGKLVEDNFDLGAGLRGRAHPKSALLQRLLHLLPPRQSLGRERPQRPSAALLPVAHPQQQKCLKTEGEPLAGDSGGNAVVVRAQGRK
jgi:flavin-dependent dehydrogenase